MFEMEAGAWQLQGMRPANHPRTRLRQYAPWTQSCFDWPAQLAAVAKILPEIPSTASTRDARRCHRFAALRKKYTALTGNSIGGTRLENLVGDGFLPLLAAHTERESAAQAVWRRWFPGDLPPRLASGLRELGVCGARSSPLTHGLAQGLLSWWLAFEAHQ